MKSLRNEKVCKRDLFQNPNIPVCQFESPVKFLNIADSINEYSGSYSLNTTSGNYGLPNVLFDNPKLISPSGGNISVQQGSVPPIKKNVPFNPQRQKPNIQALDEDTIEKANLIKASRIAYEESFEDAQDFLLSKNIPYTIDTELSTTTGLVLTNDNTGEIRISYRGTKWTSANDIKANVSILANNESADSQFKDSKTQIEAVQEKYSILPDELLGYSRGGSIAISQGNDFGIKTTTFNPLLNGNLVVKGDQGLHSIIRTTEDPVSVGTALGTFKDVRSIYPKQDSLNPIEAHTLEQFVDNNAPRRQPIDSLSAEELKPLLEAHQGSLSAVAERGNVSRSIAETISPTQVGTGLVAGVIANKIVAEIDPQNKLGNQGQEVVAGGISGGISAGFSSGLAGTALSFGVFAPAVVGGSAGYLAGVETQRAVSKAILKSGGTQAEAEIGSSAVGGSVGGLGTAVGAGLTSVALGAEAGVAFAPESLGLSVVAGAILGGVVGTGEYVYENRNQIGTEIKQEAKQIGSDIVSGAKEVGSDIKQTGEAIYHWLGG